MVAVMDYRKQSNGWLTYLEHWNIAIVSVIALVASRVLDFFMRLSGAPWLWFFFAGFALMILGGGLIAYAKLPVYRSGRFFTFGLKTVPQHLRGFYGWGRRLFLFGVVLSLCLLLSKP
jgi:hypothetical protein